MRLDKRNHRLADAIGKSDSPLWPCVVKYLFYLFVAKFSTFGSIGRINAVCYRPICSPAANCIYGGTAYAKRSGNSNCTARIAVDLANFVWRQLFGFLARAVGGGGCTDPSKPYLGNGGRGYSILLRQFLSADFATGNALRICVTNLCRWAILPFHPGARNGHVIGIILGAAPPQMKRVHASARSAVWRMKRHFAVGCIPSDQRKNKPMGGPYSPLVMQASVSFWTGGERPEYAGVVWRLSGHRLQKLLRFAIIRISHCRSLLTRLVRGPFMFQHVRASLFYQPTNRTAYAQGITTEVFA